MIAVLGLASCSDESVRRENSELRVDAPIASQPAAPRAAAPAAAASPQPIAPLAGAGRRYRVAVETAYFFDDPAQTTPNGRYLRRGDTFYGEGEANGFVKTSFVQPNGMAGTAWLKRQALSMLAGAPATGTARRVPAARPAVAPAPVATEVSEAAQPADEATGTGTAQTAVVQADRAYFYNAPDLGVPRRAFCQRGDKVRLGESRGAAVYVTFTNWEKVTTTGWMRKADLR